MNSLILRVLKPVRFFILLLSFVFLWQACKKDQRVLSSAVQPEGDLLTVGTTATVQVSAVTEAHDSIVSANNRHKFFGSHQDPLFGRTDIGLYLNANFTSVNIDYTQPVTLDSAVFMITVANEDFVGDNFSALTVSVFPLDSALNRGRIYYASNSRLHSRTPLPTIATVPVSLNTGTTVIRIPLDKAFAEAIFTNTASLVDLPTFQSTYKGFYLAASPAGTGKGVIWTCDLENPLSGLYFYYSGSAADSVFRFSFSGERAVRYNTVKHDRSAADARLLSQLQGTSLQPALLFLQGMGGTRINVSLPLEHSTLDSFDVAVNRAEVVFNVDPSLMNGYDAPPHLSLLPVGFSGRDTVAADQYSTTDNARYNGKYDPAGNRYVFNIARHVQGILSGRIINRGFRLVVSDPTKTYTLFRDELAGRVVLGGPSHSTLKPSFTLSTSKVRVK